MGKKESYKGHMNRTIERKDENQALEVFVSFNTVIHTLLYPSLKKNGRKIHR